jgi:hypothetical protein
LYGLKYTRHARKGLERERAFVIHRAFGPVKLIKRRQMMWTIPW